MATQLVLVHAGHLAAGMRPAPAIDADRASVLEDWLSSPRPARSSPPSE